MGPRRNVLLVTLDQFRGDCLGAAGHPLVRTPHLDRLAADGVRLARHYSQAAPCAPGRASLYTGMYQMNHRVVANGSPLDRRFDNVALAARRAGYRPVLFGYTDQAIDPRETAGPDDPLLFTWEGVLPGFDVVVKLADDEVPWVDWLAELGHDISPGSARLLATEHERPAEHSVSAFLTDHAIDWLRRKDEPWFAHLSYLRPHPPYSAAGRWGTAYDPADVELPIPAGPDRHPFHDFALGMAGAVAPQDEIDVRRMRAQYYGMISEVDDQFGRVLAELQALGAVDDTVIIVTSDHGEMLGDHGLKEKLGYWEQSYHVLGVVRDPTRPQTHGTVVDAFTENVDVLPTICDWLDIDVPAECDGWPLTPFLDGLPPERWRTAAHWEYDWRGNLIGRVGHEWPWDRVLERQHLAVLRTERGAYVQFGNGSWRCFDLAADPTWRTEVTDAATILALAQEMLTWRSRHTDRTLADMLVQDGGIGRWPVMPDSWSSGHDAWRRRPRPLLRAEPPMLAATLLALGAAVLHASWNLVAKRSADRFLALWGQFAVSAVIGGLVLAVTRSLPAGVWTFAAITGATHIIYIAALAHAYDSGDFSVAYPIARGGGAVLAGIGGVLLLDDHLRPLSVVAIALVAAGMGMLAVGAHRAQIATALVVAATIGVYTTNDSHASRTYDTLTYPFAAFVTIGVAVTAYGLVAGRGAEMSRTMRMHWRQYTLTGAVAVIAYAMVVFAVRSAPVGYVAALRESSVLLAAFLGARYLSESHARRRTVAAVVIMSGLVLLVATG